MSCQREHRRCLLYTSYPDTDEPAVELELLDLAQAEEDEALAVQDVYKRQAQDSAALGDVLSAGELDVVQGGYEVKFKAVELYEQLRGWMENW